MCEGWVLLQECGVCFVRELQSGAQRKRPRPTGSLACELVTNIMERMHFIGGQLYGL